MIDQASVPSLMGSTVRDSAGEKIGKVGQVYLDDTTGQPEWVTVRTGLFGTKESFVPLAAARVEGDELVVDIAKSKVHEAPRIDEEGHLSEEQETELYTYYGVSQGPFGRQTPTDAGPGYSATEAAAGAPRRRRTRPAPRSATRTSPRRWAAAGSPRPTRRPARRSVPTSPAARTQSVTGVGGGTERRPGLRPRPGRVGHRRPVRGRAGLRPRQRRRRAARPRPAMSRGAPARARGRLRRWTVTDERPRRRSWTRPVR